MTLDETIMALKDDEGFNGSPYLDHLGNPTIGYGTLLPLSRAESVLLLRHRLIQKENDLMLSTTFRQANADARSILLNMAYQLGTKGLLKFKKMLQALDEHDYEEASVQMLDSKWATQTPERANRLADLMRNIKDS
jgi:lysozyme